MQRLSTLQLRLPSFPVHAFVSIVFEGGELCGNLMFASASPINGSVTLTVNGGKFNGTSASPISITSSSSEKAPIGKNVTFNINGGSFSNVSISVAKTDSVSGKASVNLLGGEFKSGATVDVGAYSK